MKKRRLLWLDDARGLAIILVVAMHADMVPRLYGFKTYGFFEPIWEGFSLIRMPLLLLLSGFLLPNSLSKDPKEFIYGKWKFIAWPYLVWITVRYIPEIGNVPPWDLDVWLAAGYLWFLFYLFIYYMMALASKLSGIPHLALAILLWGIAWIDFEGSRFAYFGVYFFMGAALWERWPGLRLPQKPWFWSLTVLAAALAWTANGLLQDAAPLGATVLLAAFPLVLVILICQRFESARVLSPVSYVGKNSIVYYVAHFPIVAVGARILDQFAPHISSWSWAILSVVSLVGCTVLSYLRVRSPLRWLFEAPTFTREPREGIRWTSKSL